MTCLVGNSMPVTILRGADKGHADPYDTTWATVLPFPIATPCLRFGAADGGTIANYATPWWPGTRGFLADTGLDDMMLTSVGWGWEWTLSGCNGRLGFKGITRDQYGSPLGGCTVRLFRTSTDELVAKVTSDPSTGAFIATTPYADGHYMTVHKAGTPDIAGASVDTIIPG